MPPDYIAAFERGEWVPLSSAYVFSFGQRCDIWAKSWDPKTGEFTERAFPDCVWSNNSWGGIGKEWMPLMARKLVPPSVHVDFKVSDAPMVLTAKPYMADETTVEGLPMKELFGKLDEILKGMRGSGHGTPMSDFLSPRPSTGVWPPDRRALHSWVSPEGHIGWAMEALKCGRQVRRKAWASDYKFDTARGFNLNILDIMAIDWEIVK